MEQNTTTDVRTDSLKTRMAEAFVEHEDEYRNGSAFEVVYEDDEKVIVADHAGHELNEWAATTDDHSREELRSFFRAVADNWMGEQDAHDLFSYADPVVFDRFEDA